MSYVENQITHIENPDVTHEQATESSTNPMHDLAITPTHASHMEQDYVSQELNRLVDVVETAAQNFISTYSDLQRQAEDFAQKNSKDAIASAAKSARLESRKMRHAVIGLAISIAAGGTGVINSGLNERTKHQRAFETEEFRRKLERLDRISSAFTELRKVKEDALADCGTPYYDVYEVNHKRVKARFDLIKETRNADLYFGKDVLAAAKEFLAWDWTFPDYCSKVAPMHEWRSRQKTIEKMIRSTIKSPLDE